MKRNEFRLLDPLRVRWAEIDSQQIVFNAHYLMYFDTAMGAYWRALLMPYHRTMADLGGDLYLRKASIEYLASASYDDLLAVGLRCGRIGSSSIGFVGCVFNGERPLATAELIYVFADPQARKSKPVPDALREAMDRFEARQPMAEVRVGDWITLGDAARAIRSEVFVDEQGIPPELEWDAADAGCLHAVAFNAFGVAIGTGRLLVQMPGIAKIGRMAVDRGLRGNGVGRAILDALTEAACRKDIAEVLLHAQLSAVAFYSAAGFVTRGQRFDEAGIAHIEMVKRI